MLKAYRQKIWLLLQNLYLEQDSWNTSRFKISDNIIFHRFPTTPRDKINYIIRSHSLLAEQKIEKLVSKGYDFYSAKDKIKYNDNNPLPLILKQHSWGWYEPTFEELSEDSKKRLIQAEKTLDFRQTRDDDIHEMEKPLIRLKDKKRDK